MTETLIDRLVVLPEKWKGKAEVVSLVVSSPSYLNSRAYEEVGLELKVSGLSALDPSNPIPEVVHIGGIPYRCRIDILCSGRFGGTCQFVECVMVPIREGDDNGEG